MPNVDNENIYGKFSRLRFYNIINDEKSNVVRIGFRDKEIIRELKNLDYTNWKIESKYEYRVDLIANLHYGDPRLWWVITTVNDIFHPFKELEAEKILRIPNVNQLMSILV
jgi:hypothetical protein